MNSSSTPLPIERCISKHRNYAWKQLPLCIMAVSLFWYKFLLFSYWPIFANVNLSFHQVGKFYISHNLNVSMYSHLPFTLKYWFKGKYKNEILWASWERIESNTWANICMRASFFWMPRHGKQLWQPELLLLPPLLIFYLLFLPFLL